MIIHGFDPGGRTGYVKFNSNTNEILEHKILVSYKEIMKVVLKIKIVDILVYENQHGLMTTPDQFDMCKKVGFIQGICEYLEIDNYSQSPLVRRGYLKKAKEMISIYEGFEKHNIDALAHILRYIDKELINE